MSLQPEQISVIATICVGVFVFILYKLYRWTKSRSPNTEVWGTVFESLTHYVQPQGPLKEPQQEMRQEKREAGDDKDKNP